ncbi:hypothetical protein DF035_16235 [Burkholderia contaminans]|nr:hypothetical protein DF035_16235 [Burkholderia contaminans]
MAMRAMHPRDRRVVSMRSACAAKHVHVPRVRVPHATPMRAHAFPPTMQTTAAIMSHGTRHPAQHAPGT